MGRHSRKGPAPKGSDTADGSRTPGIAGERREADGAAGRGGGRRRRTGPAVHDHHAPAPPPERPGVYEGRPGSQTGPAPGGSAPFRDGGLARGGHPQQYEAGGGWGAPPAYGPGAERAGTAVASPPRGGGDAFIPGPRREFVEAFDDDRGEASARRGPGRDADRDADRDASESEYGVEGAEDGDGRAAGSGRGGGRGRTFTGIAAAAVTTVLAVVVAGQVGTEGPDRTDARTADQGRDAEERPGRSDGRPTPSESGQAVASPSPPGYEQLMAEQFPIDPELKLSGEFAAVPGIDKAPGEGRKVTYRVDVEEGLDLDAAVFARAVRETLNDDRSWAHGGAMTFERVSSGKPDFVITLASPGTTAVWCAKSGLDTTVDNVSCDSAATDRVMINAYRWAQGAETYGPDRMLAYRQMLINHEIGHRLGHNHVNCTTPGALAPVMQQQTKTLEINGITCRVNPWVHPGE
ncbi:DUF3152 domain-containing protein [Streptomyces sp. MUM 178J]|uniref:DUF3152 domain-containing protein n=1 Tax=Streptomyces sp. MUM 178J TaxID=2791991 RepID=UPI001F044DBC|nr:DUF3152 domain-containing protein [Streptomyces sp. MUM 178J]WRQ81418.1 DUF3152 domain-containing protein [Streptomyces sp. MUM 178J]